MSRRGDEQLETLTRKLARAVVSDTGDENSLAEASFNSFSEITRDKTAAPARLSELLACSSVDRQRKLLSDPRYQTYALATYTLQRSEQAIGHSPGMSLELARLARLIVARLDRRACGGSAAFADLGAYAFAMEGNAFRVSGSFHRALEKFAMAREIQGRGGGADPDLAARIDRLESSLRRCLGQLDSALALLDRSENLFDTLRSNQQLALTTINRSNVFFVQGDFDQAMALLERAQNLSQDPYVLLCVRHNSADILARSGRPQEAARLLEKNRTLYTDLGSPLLTSRRLWVESVILRKRGDLDLAQELMLEATNQLVDHGYDASFAAIELAALRERERRQHRPVSLEMNLL